MKRANVFFTLLFVIINVCRGSEPAQICHINPATRTDMCVAVQSVKSLLERGHDLLMTFSVRFHQGNGWAAFGVGNRMDRALMFVLWPGEQDGDIVLSLRSTTEHLPPNPLKNQKQIHVHGTEIDQNGLHVLRATCYSCNVIGLGELNITSENQPWLFAASYLQQTKTSDPNFRMSMHTDYGLRLVNMHRTLSMDQNEHHPTVSADRSLIHAIDPSRHHRSGHPTSTPASMNALNAHGLILSFSVILNCLGIVLIRSGLKWAFRGHWIVQVLSAIGLLTGCLMGILKSTSIFHVTTFASTHKLIGLVIAVGVPVQITLGYKHHINYVKYGHRTRASTFHIYLGRLLFVALNVNVFMGLLHGRKSNTLRLMWAVIVSVEILALAGMIFARRMNTHRAYKMVEGDEFDPFVIGDEEEK